MIRLHLYLATLLPLLLLTATHGRAAGLRAEENVVSVRDMGARGDGEADDTKAIQGAIDSCAKNGGGRVLFPPGRYLSGSVRLRSDVELHFAKGARLIAAQDLDAYLGFESGEWGNSRWNRGLIVGEGLQNVKITGQGIIDGNKVFDPKGEAGMRGPHTVLLSNCQDVTLSEVTIRDSANYAFLFYASKRVRVQNATFEGGWDGVHFRGSLERWNEDVRIRNCRFFTGDDCIAGHYIQDAIIEDCLINSSCNGVRLIGPAKGLTFKSCRFEGPGKFEHRTRENLHRTNMLAGILLQPSAWTPTPGPLEDVLVRDVTMNNVACALHVSTRPGNTADRLTFKNIEATDVYSAAVSFESWAEKRIDEVTVRNLKVKYEPDAVIDPRLGKKPRTQDPIRKPGVGVWNRKLPVWGLYGRRIDSLLLEGVSLSTSDGNDARPVVRLDDVKDFNVKKLTHSPLPPNALEVQRGAARVRE